MPDPKTLTTPSQNIAAGSAPPPLSPVRSHENRLLASLPESDMALLAPRLQVISVRPGAVLQLQGHPTEYVYFPHEGLVSLHAMTLDGHTIQAASVGRAGAVCPTLKLDMAEAFFSAVALSEMRVSRIGVGAIRVAEGESETINRTLGACRQAHLLQLRQNIICYGLHSTDQRLARWILELADRLESYILPIPVTQEYVAQCLGIRRTTVTLVARALQDAQGIRWSRSRVEILDRARIEAAACCCYADLRQRMSKLRSDDAASAGSVLAD